MIDERTEKRICDLYRYQSLEGYGAQAIEEAHREYQIPRTEIIEILHRNGLALKFGRESKEEKVKTKPDKESIIHDYNEGMKVKDIAERYGLNPNSVYHNLKSWSTKGLVTLRTPSKPVHISSPLKTEKEPASAATDTSPCEKLPIISLNQNSEIVKPNSSYGFLTSLIESFDKTFSKQLVNSEIKGVFASASQLCAELIIQSNGKIFVLKLSEQEE